MIVEIKQITKIGSVIDYELVGEVLDDTLTKLVYDHGGSILKGDHISPDGNNYYIDVEGFIEKYGDKGYNDNTEKLLLCLKQYVRETELNKLERC